MTIRCITEGIPMAPRVQEWRQRTTLSGDRLVARFRESLGAMGRLPMAADVRLMICGQLERIWGRIPPRMDLDLVTHLLVSMDRGVGMRQLWGMDVLPSQEVDRDDQVVLAAYEGLDAEVQGESPGDRIRFRPIVRLVVRWDRDPSVGALVEGVDLLPSDVVDKRRWLR